MVDTDDNDSGFGLGRGLDALFGDDDAPMVEDEVATEEPTSEEVEEPVADIEPEAQDDDNDLSDAIAAIDSMIDHMSAAEEEPVAEDSEVAETVVVETVAEDVVIEEAPAEDDMEFDMAAAMEAEAAEVAPASAPEEKAPRKSLTDAADSLVSALEVHASTETPADTSSSGRLKVLPVENLYPSPFQPRKIFREESISELASSIRQYGVLQPLLVRKDPKNDDGYEIIAGERRWRAAQQAQVHELPAIIMNIDELEAYKIALIENLQREDIDPIDEAAGYQKLLEDFGQTQEQLAEAVGKSRPHITNTLRLLQLPPLTQSMLCEGAITMGHARALIGVDNADEIAQKIHKQGLSVRQTEKLAASAKGKTQESRPRSASPANTSVKEKDADTIALENDMSNALGMKVSIDSTDGKSGKLSVEFKSLDQLDELLHRLAHFPGARLSG